MAGLMLRVAGGPIPPPSPPPTILPGPDDIPGQVAGRAPVRSHCLYRDRLMGHVAAPEARAAAVTILRRTYSGIGPQAAVAHESAMAFNGQLQALLKIEAAAAAADSRLWHWSLPVPQRPPVLHRLADVRLADALGVRQVGDGTRHAQDAVVGAARPLKLLHRRLQARLAGFVRLAELVDLARGQVLVALALA